MPTILVVDDQPGVREMLRLALRRAGHDVILADSGAGALEVLRARPIDVLITDLNMPGIGGLELISAIRDDKPQLRIVLMTGSDYHGPTDIGGRLRGVGVLLRKPFLLTDLHAAIERCQAY